MRKDYKILTILGLMIFIIGTILFIITFAIDPNISIDNNKTLVWSSIICMAIGYIIMIVSILLDDR